MIRFLSTKVAAARVGVDVSTLRDWIAAGRIVAVVGDGTGRLWVDERELEGLERSPRGRRRVSARRLRGREFRAELRKLGSVAAVADAYGVSHQAVAEAIARYDAARERAKSAR